MDWVEHLNEAMDYIEKRLAEELSYEEIAKRACCSAYHFQRMFTYMAGVPLAEYIRRRRMSLAAAELSAGEKVIDVALKYGYASPTAFNRAFQAIHGIAPSGAKKEGVSLKSYPPLRFQVIVKGVEEMNYRLEEKKAFRIMGISAPLSREVEENFAVVPQMWGRAAAEGLPGRLVTLMDSQPAGILGVSACGDEEQWRYFIAVATTAPLEDGLEEYTVPAATWAVFPGEGTNRSIQELERRIVTEWLPSSGYEYANAPDIEVYLNADPQNARYEVWIPVTKKKEK